MHKHTYKNDIKKYSLSQNTLRKTDVKKSFKLLNN